MATYRAPVEDQPDLGVSDTGLAPPQNIQPAVNDQPQVDMAAPDTGTATTSGAVAGGSAAGPTNAADVPNAPSTLNATDFIHGFLDQYGLGDLADWAMTQIKGGITTPEELNLAITQTPQFKARFPAIEQRRLAGLPGINPGQYVQLERQYTATMRQAGLPQGFWDKPADFTNLIASDVSPMELDERVKQGYLRVTQAPDEVRQWFANKYGANGDAALASVFLDPTRAVSELERQAAEAEIGGTGMRFGFDVNEPLAQQLARQGVTASAAQTGFEKLGAEQDLFKATVGEAGETPLTQETGIKAEFGVSGEAQNQLRQRMQERQSEFTKGKAGGAEEVAKRGITGLAAAGT